MAQEEVFISKRDRWAGVMFWGFAFFAWGFGLWDAFALTAWADRVATAGISILAGCAVLWFWFTTRYRVTSSTLHLHSGPFHSEIPLHKIRAVIVSRKGWGMSYSLSLKGIQLEVEGSRLGYQFSPRDRSGFMTAIARRCPHLEVQGADLICRS